MTAAAIAFDPAPARLDDVVDPAWLSAMLSTRWPGTIMRAATIVETIVTMATKVRLVLAIEGGGPDVPTALCIKGVLLETGAVASSSIIETLFYRDVAAGLDIRVPPCLYAALDAGGTRGVIVMEDVIAAGSRFCGALEPFTADLAADGLDQLARLHVAGAEGTPLYDRPFTPAFLDFVTKKPIMPLDRLQSLLDGPRGDPLPAALRDAARLQRGLEALAAQVRAGPKCLVHGDAHAGNVYRDPQGRICLVDWQILQKGDWAQDVAYHLAAVLTPEDRRTHERALLRDYLARLHALGGPAIDPDHAWRRYRAAMVYGFYLWAITVKVDQDVTHEFVRRLGLAVDDLESFAALAA